MKITTKIEYRRVHEDHDVERDKKKPARLKLRNLLKLCMSILKLLDDDKANDPSVEESDDVATESSKAFATD